MPRQRIASGFPRIADALSCLPLELLPSSVEAAKAWYEAPAAPRSRDFSVIKSLTARRRWRGGARPRFACGCAGPPHIVVAGDVLRRLSCALLEGSRPRAQRSCGSSPPWPPSAPPSSRKESTLLARWACPDGIAGSHGSDATIAARWSVSEGVPSWDETPRFAGGIASTPTPGIGRSGGATAFPPGGARETSQPPFHRHIFLRALRHCGRPPERRPRLLKRPNRPRQRRTRATRQRKRRCIDGKGAGWRGTHQRHWFKGTKGGLVGAWAKIAL